MAVGGASPTQTPTADHYAPSDSDTDASTTYPDTYTTYTDAYRTHSYYSTDTDTDTNACHRAHGNTVTNTGNHGDTNAFSGTAGLRP